MRRLLFGVNHFEKGAPFLKKCFLESKKSLHFKKSGAPEGTRL